MSYPSRPLPSHLRQASASNNGNSLQGQSPVLLARINEKRQELENLKELRDLSAGLAGQMTVLEEKLATLSNGTEGRIQHDLIRLQSYTDKPVAVAMVLGNWHNVLRAISMASSKYISYSRKAPTDAPQRKYRCLRTPKTTKNNEMRMYLCHKPLSGFPQSRLR